MAGLYTDGVPQLSSIFGLETAPWDTALTGGSTPQSGSLNMQELALWMSLYTDSVSTATVAGSRYYRSVNIGFPYVATGMNVKVGATDGTDLWSVQLWLDLLVEPDLIDIGELGAELLVEQVDDLRQANLVHGYLRSASTSGHPRQLLVVTLAQSQVVLPYELRTNVRQDGGIAEIEASRVFILGQPGDDRK